MNRFALFLVAALASIGLVLYPVFYVVFPWTVPLPYLLALVVSLNGVGYALFVRR